MKNAILVFALCLLCACSNTRLAYNYLDWIITWYLEDYVNLNSQQDDYYHQRLKVLLQWHRKEQLALYSLFANQLQQDIRGKLTPELLQERFNSLKQFWQQIMERAAPECAGLLLLLDREQRKAMYAVIEKKNKELENKYRGETAAMRKARHFDQAVKPLKRFIGPLTVQQTAALDSWAEGLAPLQNLWLENRCAWQKNLQAVLEGNEHDAEKRRLLARLLIEPEYLWAPAYRHAINRNETATLAMLAGLLETLTEKQKQHAQNALETLKEDCILLSKE